MWKYYIFMTATGIIIATFLYTTGLHTQIQIDNLLFVSIFPLLSFWISALLRIRAVYRNIQDSRS